MKELERNVRNGDTSQTAGVVFVCFDKQEVNNFILEKTVPSFLKKLTIKFLSNFFSHENMVKMFPSNFFFNGCLLDIERAPEPSDINWINMGVS